MDETHGGFAIDFTLELQTAVGPSAQAGCNFRAVTNAFELLNYKLPLASTNNSLPTLFSCCACDCSCKPTMDSHSEGISCH